jgi:hypothetical protein
MGILILGLPVFPDNFLIKIHILESLGGFLRSRMILFLSSSVKETD